MIDEQDEIVQFLNTRVTLWDGLKSERFWQELREEGKITFLSIYLLVFVVGCLSLYFKSEVESGVRATLILLLMSLLVSIIVDFRRSLRLYQLKRQLKIIEFAESKAAEAQGEEH